MKSANIMLCFFLLVYCLSSATCSELLGRHRRSWIIDSFTIEEGHPGPFPYELGQIQLERSYLVDFDLYGEGVNLEPKGVLSIDKNSGILKVHKALDYEQKQVLKLKFEARKPNSITDTRLGVEISVLDINDNPPRFPRDLYEISLDEEATQGSHLLTLVAYDRDQRGTPNSTFHYEIRSVSPNPPDIEFFIDEFGTISFKGCLDHEVAKKFTVVVEAKDHGEAVSLSSSTSVVFHVEDGNNHLPTISRTTGSGRVKENETGTSPLRLHVTDKDTPNSPAWRARYTIQGDEGRHFKIQTDPDTNDGILTVVKPLDFEEDAQKQLTISVENEVPYFSCEVKERTSSGLWKVDTSKAVNHQPHSVKVTIEVEDTNDPPLFSVTVKEAVLEENAPIGTWIEKVTAVDPDSSHARDFVYKIGNDPAGLMTVDPQTGDITTAKIVDRESPYVVNGVYSILLYAVDKGEPPMTGTATLNLHVIDQNDNVPKPSVDYVDVCVSDSPYTTNITATDLDQNPFGGPFIFELLGDVNGKWKLNPSYGFAAGLVKEPSVYAGPHTVKLKISDMQGEFGVYSLSVIACDCSATHHCRNRHGTATISPSGAFGIVLATTLLLLFLLLMAVVITCKKEFTPMQTSTSSGETLLPSNIEEPGTDCQIPDSVLALSTDETSHDPSDRHDGMQNSIFSTNSMEQNFINKHFGDYRGQSVSHLFTEHWNQIESMNSMQFLNKRSSSYVRDAALRALLHQRLSSLQESEGDLPVYQTHIYADEGNSDSLPELENIDILDGYSFQEALEDLGPNFRDLAYICNPHI